MTADRPTTAAGRALLASAWQLAPGEPLMLDTILAIEAEVSQPDSEALRRFVQKVAEYCNDPHLVVEAENLVWLAARPPSASNSGGSVTNVPLGEFHDGIPQMAPPSAPPALDVAGLFRVPFDRDGRLYPDEADNWSEEHFAAFHAGVEVGIEVVRGRYENPDEWRRSSKKAALASQPGEYWTTEEPEK